MRGVLKILTYCIEMLFQVFFPASLRGFYNVLALHEKFHYAFVIP